MQCLYCSKELTGNQRKYCSISCKSKYQSVKPDGSRPKRLENCEICGKTLTGNQRQFCSSKCKMKIHPTYPSMKRRRISRKLEIVELSGGECQQCGYKDNLSALTFHHVEEGKKGFSLTNKNVGGRPMEQVLTELEKCELYCRRCHMELHHPTLAKDVVENTMQNLKKLNTFNQIEGCCIICAEKLEGNNIKFCSQKCQNAYHQNYAKQQLRGIERKIKLVTMLGGACSSCGYDDNLAGLDFHHEGDKDYKLDLRNLANRTWKTVLKEAENCVLLCSNCHMEEHHPELTVAEITKTHPV